MATQPCVIPDAATLIATERGRQIHAEGYTPTDDITRGADALRDAAHAYATGDPTWWPWSHTPWTHSRFKPRDPVRDLVRAGALYHAALDVTSPADHGTREGIRADLRRTTRRLDAILDAVRALSHPPETP